MIGTHLPLHQSDAHSGLLVHIGVRGRLIVDVVPLQKSGAVLRLLVVGQIIADNTTHVEIVGELEGEHRVIDFA